MVTRSVRASSERLLNLLFALRQGWMTRTSIRSDVEGYQNLSDDAFSRMFERDKAILRGLGIGISTTDWKDKRAGTLIYCYHITDEEYALDPIAFTPEEVDVLRAARAWLPANSPGWRGLTKLTGHGYGLATRDHTVPSLPLNSELFGRFATAVHDRRPQRFEYRKPGGVIEMRTVFPYGVCAQGTRAYVIGWDPDREGLRMFRLSRIHGKLAHHPKYRNGAYEIPEDFSVRAFVEGNTRPLTITLDIRAGRAEPLRERARATGRIEPKDATTDRVTLEVTDTVGLVSELLSYGSALTVIAPEDLVVEYTQARQDTVAQLTRIAGEN